MDTWPETTWVIVGSTLGAFIAGLSQILSSWLQWKRDEKATRRADRTKNLYLVQDEVLALQMFVEERILVKTNPSASNHSSELVNAEERRQIEIHSRALMNLSIRVGDLPLTNANKRLVKHLADGLGEGSRQVRIVYLNDAKYSLLSLQLRIRQLLHTDIETDTGDYGRWPLRGWRKRKIERDQEKIQHEVDKAKSVDEKRFSAHQDVLRGRTDPISSENP